MIKYVLIFSATFSGCYFLLCDAKSKKIKKIKVKKNIIKKESKLSEKITDYKEKAKRYLETVRYNLLLTKSRLSLKQYLLVQLALGICGIVIGLSYNNILMSALLGIGLPALLYLYLSKKAKDSLRNQNEMLEIYMGMVTNAYIQNNNLEVAIRDCFARMSSKETASRPFALFLAEAGFSSDMRRCIETMKKESDNIHFKQWCDKLALCHENSELVRMLPYVVNRMRRKRTLTEDAVTSAGKPYSDFIAICLVTIVTTFIFPRFDEAWEYAAMHTFIGKIAIAAEVVVILLACRYVVKVSK